MAKAVSRKPYTGEEGTNKRSRRSSRKICTKTYERNVPSILKKYSRKRSATSKFKTKMDDAYNTGVEFEDELFNVSFDSFGIKNKIFMPNGDIEETNIKMEDESAVNEIQTENHYKRLDYNKKYLNNKENSMLSVRYKAYGDRNIKVWQCGVCGKDFRHQYTLSRHLPTHTDERNYKCDTCGKAFRQMSTLSQHRAIHSDARPYICEFCRKSFNRVSTLISHKKTHSDYKPHQCNICGKAFHQKGNLRNHIFTHTNERPYKCDVCNKGFNQMSNLMCHKAHAHSEKMYPCILCDEIFVKRSSLKSHEELIHGIKYSSKELKLFEERKKSLYVLDGKDVNTFEPGTVSHNMLNNIKVTRLSSNGSEISAQQSVVAGVCIDLIKTKAMEAARANGQTPFALLKPSTGIPVLVKVLNANSGSRHMLVPATASDLKSAGKITVSSNEDSANVKAVQIKVPVVATVIQTFDAMGKMQISIEPPGPELENRSSELKVEPNIYCDPVETDTKALSDSYHVLTLSEKEARFLLNIRLGLGGDDSSDSSDWSEDS